MGRVGLIVVAGGMALGLVFVVIVFLALQLFGGSNEAVPGEVFGTGGVGLRLYTEPSEQAEQLGLIPEGDPMDVLSERDVDEIVWFEVEYQDSGQSGDEKLKGWVVAQFVRQRQTEVQASPTAVLPNPTATPPPARTTPGSVSASDGAPIHRDPSTASPVLLTAPSGAQVDVIRTFSNGEGAWIELRYNDIQGWTRPEYVQTQPSPGATPQLKVTPAPVAIPSVVFGTEGSGLSLRAEPSVDADRLDLMPDGAEIAVLETREAEGREWSRVRYDDLEGWAASEYIQPR